eukprot:scaffold5369_cov115-Isochrysis_galbana.AAC.2
MSESLFPPSPSPAPRLFPAERVAPPTAGDVRDPRSRDGTDRLLWVRPLPYLAEARTCRGGAYGRGGSGWAAAGDVEFGGRASATAPPNGGALSSRPGLPPRGIACIAQPLSPTRTEERGGVRGAIFDAASVRRVRFFYTFYLSFCLSSHFWRIDLRRIDRLREVDW